MSRRCRVGLVVASVMTACGSPHPVAPPRVLGIIDDAVMESVAVAQIEVPATPVPTTSGAVAAVPVVVPDPIPPAVEPVTPTTVRTPPPRAAPVESGGRCGGSLPPCWVMHAESGGDIIAYNRSSGAAGKWQAIPSTWAGYGGYASAADAPESVQDEFARRLWANGRGCSHWSAC